MKQAMRDRNKEKLSAIRLMLSSVKQFEVDKRQDVTDEIVVTIMRKMRKQREDSYQQYMNANREDLAKVEKFELEILANYLPEELSIEAIRESVLAAIKDTNSSSMKDMGKIMGVLQNKLKGKADMSLVNKAVKTALSEQQ
ncbi:MAG: glutamyl-tRNA amidotransferase [Thiotrichales bacterium]|nr:MAG: glutamyl-tRNA amidotransferase [Thiotrichales bacterium]